MEEDILRQAVKELLPVISPFSLHDAEEFEVLFTAARNATAYELSALPDTQLPLAIVYYIAHLQAVKAGKLAITSERLGEWSASYGTGSTPFYDTYLQYISGAVMDATLSNSKMITHHDTQCADRKTLDGYRGGGCGHH